GRGGRAGQAPAQLGLDPPQPVLTPGRVVRLAGRTDDAVARHAPQPEVQEVAAVALELLAPGLVAEVAARLGPGEARALDDVAQAGVAPGVDALRERGAREREQQ